MLNLAPLKTAVKLSLVELTDYVLCTSAGLLYTVTLTKAERLRDNAQFRIAKEATGLKVYVRSITKQI
jgi:hypothetical protein